MCGIVGFIGACDSQHIQQATACLRHRGPDGEGYYTRGFIHIGATRLSIVDPAADAQPVFNETRTCCVVFNGEIYNHRQLREHLRARGHIFATQTDTEVVIHLYEEYGRDFVQHLRGMFALAIPERNRLLLARDRLGIKPLFYTILSKHQLFVFASEIKAILQRPEYAPRLNMQAFADSLVLGHLVEQQTFFEGIQSLPAGHMMTASWDEGIQVCDPEPYYVRNDEHDETLSLAQAEVGFEAVLQDAVLTHMSADVDVGLTLSGGIDSTILALLANEVHGTVLRTFSVADHSNHSDLKQARFVANLLQSDHHEVVIRMDQYLAMIPALIVAEEKPSSLLGLPFHWLCREMSTYVKCSLNGEGADELLGGYTEYIHQERRTRHYQQRLPLLKELGILPSDAAIALMTRLSSGTTFDEYLERIFEVNLGAPLQRNHLDLVDRCSMAAGLEMRVPYLDDRVVDFVSRLPVRYLVRKDLGIRKYLLRRMAVRRFGDTIIDIVLREKVGGPAAGVVLLDRFDRMCEETLPDTYLSQHPLGQYFEGKRQLLVFELFLEIFMRHRGDHHAVGTIEDFLAARAAAAPTAGAGVEYI